MCAMADERLAEMQNATGSEITLEKQGPNWGIFIHRLLLKFDREYGGEN